MSLDDLLGWDATVPAAPVKATISGGLAKMTLAAAVLGVMVSMLTLPFIAAGAISMREAGNYWDSLPSKLPVMALPQRSQILAADGSKIAVFYSENRVQVPLTQVPQVIRDAVVSIEDSRFYDHAGVDVRGTARAAVSNLLSDSTQGGSTLTQQYVKQVLADAADSAAERAEVTSRTSYMRKLREAKLALETEKRLSKDQILEGYLNIAYFGDGAYGIATAARHYFNKPLRKVTLPEAALLAGLVQNPTTFDPTNNLNKATVRRNIVLMRMHELGKITTAAYEKAKVAPVRLDLTQPKNGCVGSRYPFFCQYVKQQLESDPVFGATPAERQQRLYRGGMVIKTTLDPKKQDLAQRAVDEALGRANRVAAASVTVQPGTGKVVAMATNRTFGKPKKGSFEKTELLLPVLPAYQSGSNFKPFTLAAALERGFDPATKMTAPPVYAPAGMNYPGSGFQNSGSSASGTFTAAQAVWRSSNTWFVKLEEQVGVLNVAATAERLGITTLPRTGKRAITARDAALTLGVHEVSPLEMAGAYATFAAHGVHCTPVVIDSITGPTGKVEVPDANCHEALPAYVADTVATIMAGTINGPDPYRTGKAMAFGRPAAGKTGTTQGNAAVWFSGFTPQYATSVWVGDPRGGFAYPLRGFYAQGRYVSRAYGGLVAGPIWRQVMAGVHEGLPEMLFTPPSKSVGYSNVAPDVRGFTLPQAVKALEDAGFTVKVDPVAGEPDPLLGPNRVLTTSPAPGTLVGAGTGITIQMTAGSKTVRPKPRVVEPSETGGPLAGGGVLTPSPGAE